MQRVVKTISTEDGKLYVTSGSNRYLLASCGADIEIVEDAEQIPVLGKGRIIRNRYVTILMTFDQRMKFEPDTAKMDGFSFTGEVLRKDGSQERIVFNKCLLASDLDLTDNGSCTFEVSCSQDMLKTLQLL